MGLTFSTETGTGSSQVYDIRWESELGYLAKSDVYVYYGDDYTQQQIPFTWVNATQIQLTATAASTFRIRRVVDRSKAVNDYVDGAILRDKNLDDSYAQALMILEEITDGWLQPNGEVFILNDLDMQNVYNVINIRDPQLDGDAVNLRHLNQELANADFQGVVPLIQPRQQGDGVTTVFNTPTAVKRQEQSFFVNVDGIGQRPYTDYTIGTDGSMTFDEAPPKGADIDITLFEPNNRADDITINNLSDYTDIVYKASGGNSAVENMVAGVPIAAKVGDVTSFDNFTWRKISDSNGTIDDYELISVGGLSSTAKYNKITVSIKASTVDEWYVNQSTGQDTIGAGYDVLSPAKTIQFVIDSMPDMLSARYTQKDKPERGNF